VIAYVDASVLLRFALGQPDALPEWRQIEWGVSSALVRTESLRMLDRLRLRANLANAEVAKRRATILAVIALLEVVDVEAAVSIEQRSPCPPNSVPSMPFTSLQLYFGKR
jgi:predicted nucleic acid-binding protein